MVNVDNLSDSELRTKLMEYGFPALPITSTTRKVMVKKLKLLMENKSSANPDSRRSLGKYSSEDDSDNEVKVAKTKRRATMAAPPIVPPQPKPTLKKTTRIVETTIEEDVPKKEIRANTSTSSTTFSRASRIVQKRQDEFDTGSESETEIIQRSQNVSPEIENKLGGRQYGLGSSFGSSNTIGRGESPKKILDNSYSSVFPSPVSDRPAAFSSPISTDAASDRLNQIRSRLNLGQSAVDRGISSFTHTTSTNLGTNADKVDTPFLSNFTRRLSQLSASKGNEHTYRSDTIKEHDTNGATGHPRTTQFTRSTLRPREYQYDYNKANYNSGNLLKDNLVPFTVLGVAVLFFIFVGFIYLGMRSDTSLEPSGYKVPYCDYKNSHHTRGVNCVLEGDVQNAINLLKPIRNELKKRGIEKLCWSPKAVDRMEDKDVVEFVEEKFGVKNRTRVINDLRNLQVLIIKNPSWGLSIVQAAPEEDITEKHVVKNLDKLGFERVVNPVSLIYLNPDIPWSCSIANKFFLMAKTGFMLIAIFGSIYVCNLAYKRYSDYQRRHRNEVISLVEKILDVLQTEVVGNEGDGGYMVINHVRDMIIPVNDRKSKEKIWRQAVQFINENESRVRTEVQVVQGEEYFVWRWVGASTLSLNASKNNKSWQGQAFETQMGAVNSLPCSPTPCLKIRGMVEDGDRNSQLIREAVLSKCASKCRILDCSVDVSMKCVYLKCADTADAAVAYQNLHGWWYAGQLVTVKYLRLERYMQRFPNSPISGPPYLRATLPPSKGWTS
ncbi:hypothetical protein WA026_020488 [Henosepilachna vigintioctopunctata]|uniref:LEM domain-containing protein n=1 Tax=Henosepilachna vigintioctopunctata TaxID=420089 RepID=A0AAW1VFH1_9CUCU